MKKIFTIVVAALCSVMLLPNSVSANSWNEHITFAIANYDTSKNSFSVTIEMLHDSEVSDKSFAFEYMKEDEEGNLQKVTENGFVHMGGTPLDEDTNAVEGAHIVKNISVLPSNPVVVLHVDVEGYKGDLEIDVTNFKMAEGATYPASYPDTTSIKESNVAKEDIEVELKDDTKLSNDYLKQAIDDQVGLYAGKVNEDGKTALYMWYFDGKKMTKSDYDLDLGVTIGSSKNDKLMNSLVPSSKDAPLPVEFAYHGELPEGTIVVLNVSKTYQNGEKLTLYYFHEDTEKLEEVATDIEVVDGYIALQMEHCSEYVLAKENAAPNNAQTSSMNVVFYAGVAICSLVGIVLLLASQRNKVKGNN